MSAKQILAISDKAECQEDFLTRIHSLASSDIGALILREKSLSKEQYLSLAKQVLQICDTYRKPCFLHTFYEVALKLNHRYFHAPLEVLRTQCDIKRHFDILGTSIHSSEELALAVRYKADYAIVGNIFETSCKPNAKAKGIAFLKELCACSTIPLYAIGGITLKNIKEFANIDVRGVCMRQSLMRCPNPREYIRKCLESMR